MLYSIEISGNGAEVGIHKLTKAQYDFWAKSENQQYLKRVLVEDYSDFSKDLPDEYFFSGSYSDLCNVDYLGGGYLGGLMIEISPIPEDDEDIDELYSFDDKLNDFIESLTPAQYKKIVNVEEFELPAKKSKTPAYLVWKAEETGMFLEGEIDVGKKFDIKKLRLNFRKVLGDIFLESVSYDDYQLESTESWETGALDTAEIIEA